MTSIAPTPSELPDDLPAQLGAAREPGPPGEIRLRVDALAFARAARMLRDAGARFVTMFLAETPEPALVGAFALRGELIVLRAPDRRPSLRVYGSLGELVAGGAVGRAGARRASRRRDPLGVDDRDG